MKNVLIGIMLSIAASTSAYACEIRGTGLPPAAIAELKVACEQAKLNNLTEPTSNAVTAVADKITVENLSAMGNVSVEIAKAIGLAAKELGIAVNDFMMTPAGILVVLGVFWKLFLVQSIGLVLLTILLVSSFWMYRRCLIEKFEPVQKSLFWGLYTYTKQSPLYSSISNLDGNQGGMMFFTTVYMLLGTWIILGTMVM